MQTGFMACETERHPDSDIIIWTIRITAYQIARKDKMAITSRMVVKMSLEVYFGPLNINGLCFQKFIFVNLTFNEQIMCLHILYYHKSLT